MSSSFFSRFRVEQLKNLNRAQIDRLFSAALLLAILGTLPEFQLTPFTLPQMLLAGAWVFQGILAIIVIGAPALFLPFYLLCLVNLFLLGVKTGFWGPGLMLLLWGLWVFFRNQNRRQKK